MNILSAICLFLHSLFRTFQSHSKRYATFLWINEIYDQYAWKSLYIVYSLGSFSMIIIDNIVTFLRGLFSSLLTYLNSILIKKSLIMLITKLNTDLIEKEANGIVNQSLPSKMLQRNNLNVTYATERGQVVSR